MSHDPTHARIEALLQHAGWLDELARRLVSDEHDADEIVQDTWIAALTHPPRHSAHLRGWLARVARNVAVQRGRSEGARRLREQATARHEASTLDGDALERARTMRRLVDAVLGLEDPYRSTLVLHYFERMPVADVAARQAVAESTVRTRLWRAIGILRERLQREHGEAWSLAFMTLARPGTLASNATVGTSAAFIGGIAMATGWKVGVSVAAVIILGWALWPSHHEPIGRELDVARTPHHPIETLSDDAHAASRVALEQPEPVGQGDGNASSSSPPKDRASLDVDVKWGDDGTPAAGIVVGLVQFGSPDLTRDRAMQSTDAQGRAHFDALFPGGLSVQADRCFGRHVDLAAGEKGRCDLVIPDGMDVDLHVVDERGASVPRARIWISSGSQTDGLEIGKADSSGHFYVRDLRVGGLVAALCDGHGPSTQVRIDDDAKKRIIPVELELTQCLGRVRGLVRDVAGAPIAGAVVELTSRRDAFTQRPSNETSYFPPVHAISDALGSFEARDLRKDDVWVEVHAAGFVAWKGTLRRGLEDKLFDIRMTKQGVVHGVVRDDAGAPLAHVRVWSGSDPMIRTWTHADGSYRLEGLPGKKFEIHADARDNGSARSAVELKEGDDVAWDVTLHPSAGVAGRVTDEAGQPLVNWRVFAVVPQPEGASEKLRDTRTAADGGFEFTHWPEEAYAIEVREPEGYSREPSVSRGGVKPGTRDLVLVVRKEDMGTSRVIGRVLDADGFATSGVPIYLHQQHSPLMPTCKSDHDGSFQMVGLRPGSYWLEIQPNHAPPKELHDLIVSSPGQVLDVGDIRLTGSGQLRVRLHLPASSEVAEDSAVLTLRKPGAELGRAVRLKQDVGALDGIEPGRYELVLFDIRLRAPKTDVTIELNRTTEVDLAAEVATCRGLRFDLPSDGQSPKQIRVRVFDDSGGVIDYEPFPGTMKSGLVRNLVVGRYRLEAETDTGLKASLTFQVQDLQLSQDVLHVVLH